jgi:hypothetical protein
MLKLKVDSLCELVRMMMQVEDNPPLACGACMSTESETDIPEVGGAP